MEAAETVEEEISTILPDPLSVMGEERLESTKCERVGAKIIALIPYLDIRGNNLASLVNE